MSLARECIGYLETTGSYKHMFFARHVTLQRPERNTTCSVSDVMRRIAHAAVVDKDQLKLAHKTALAMLQYNNTPWLSERWRLDQLMYFGNDTSFNETSLETLHLTSKIGAIGQTSDMTMGDTVSSTEMSDEIRYGINNRSLFFLGIALLEIAHWQTIEEQMTDRDGKDQVYAARRLANGSAPMGPVYQKIARKCLQCDFGFGTDLSNEELQAAVYRDVICVLESMIKQLGS